MSLLVLENEVKKWILAYQMDEENLPLTTFTTPQGDYRGIVMSFSHKIAPRIFKRRMENIFKRSQSLLSSLH